MSCCSLSAEPRDRAAVLEVSPLTASPGPLPVLPDVRRDNVVADKTVVLIVEDDQNIVDLIRSHL